jgi:hypothetical protein
MKFKVGDIVEVKRLAPEMPKNVSIGDILTVANIDNIFGYDTDNIFGYDTINCKEKLTNGNWNVNLFELYSEALAPGLYFKKDNSIFIVAESANQMWLVDLSSGRANWLSKTGANTLVNVVENCGYSRVELSKEVFTVIARVNS